MFVHAEPLRNKIEKQFGKISDELFLEVLEVTMNDISANVYYYGKRADFSYIYFVAESYLKMIFRQELLSN